MLPDSKTFLAILCPILQKYLFSSCHIEVASKTSWPFIFILDGKEEVEFCLFFLSKLLITFQVVEVFLLLLISVEKKDALAASFWRVSLLRKLLYV